MMNENEEAKEAVTVTLIQQLATRGMSVWREPGQYRTHDPVKHMLVRVRLRRVTTASASRAPVRRDDDAMSAPAATISALAPLTHPENGRGVYVLLCH